MTILLYDYCELEERTSKHFKIWKACHITLYILVAVFGVVNYSSLEGTLQLYNQNCILYPRKLEFHEVEIPCSNITDPQNIDNATGTKETAPLNSGEIDEEKNATAQNTDEIDQRRNGTATYNTNAVDRGKRESVSSRQVNVSNADNDRSIDQHDAEKDNEADLEGCDGNETSWHRPALDVGRTLFGDDNDCQWALYTPLASTIFAAVWVAMFTMCPGGGSVRAGLQQPWRILAPALLFAVVLAVVTGHSFSRTSGGLHAFCASFANITNTTACSPVGLYTESAWNASIGVGNRVAVTRAASAGVWASWACAAALLLARCLAAPDFVVRRTGVLLKDPQQVLHKEE